MKEKIEIKPSECEFTKSIILRYPHMNPAYCVNIKCNTHKAEWSGLTNDLDVAKSMVDSFPLVRGGLTFGKDALPIPENCIIAHIPQKELK